MQTIVRVPSKKVQYGYVEFILQEGESWPDPVETAEAYVQYIKDYQAAEVQAFENPAIRQIKKADTTEDINEVAANEIKSQLGATDVTSAPWANAPSESKDWEEPKDAAPAAPVDDSKWTF